MTSPIDPNTSSATRIMITKLDNADSWASCSTTCSPSSARTVNTSHDSTLMLTSSSSRTHSSRTHSSSSSSSSSSSCASVSTSSSSSRSTRRRWSTTPRMSFSSGQDLTSTRTKEQLQQPPPSSPRNYVNQFNTGIDNNMHHSSSASTSCNGGGGGGGSSSSSSTTGTGLRLLGTFCSPRHLQITTGGISPRQQLGPANGKSPSTRRAPASLKLLPNCGRLRTPSWRSDDEDFYRSRSS
ncbi:unnamed protein product, partial [Amoebophrya sp. A25]|eukprot:GSA25T00003501001.1